MWAAVLNESDRFADRILAQEAKISSWEEARLTYLTPSNQDPFELGYATFLLNRWNRSGILDARPIGGLKQTGTWKIDARFNRANLAERVRFLGQYKNRIRITRLDGREFLTQLEGANPNTLVYVDPPYLKQGEDLYFDALTYEDHQELAKQLRASSMRWFLTYDVDARITDALYPELRCASFRIAHTAQKQHVGVEYAVFSDSLSVPDLELVRRADGTWITTQGAS
jgi:DNA adenine methylase